MLTNKVFSRHCIFFQEFYDKFPVLEKFFSPLSSTELPAFAPQLYFPSNGLHEKQNQNQIFFKEYDFTAWFTIFARGFGSGFSDHSNHPRSTAGDRMTILLMQTQDPVQGYDSFWCKRYIRQLAIQLLSQSENRQGIQLCSDLHQYCIFTFKELAVISSDMTNKTHSAASLYRKFSISKCIKLCSSCF